MAKRTTYFLMSQGRRWRITSASHGWTVSVFDGKKRVWYLWMRYDNYQDALACAQAGGK